MNNVEMQNILKKLDIHMEHPGNVLLEKYTKVGDTIEALAERCTLPVNEVQGIINGTINVTTFHAICLAKGTSTSSMVWSRIQNDIEARYYHEYHKKNCNGKDV